MSATCTDPATQARLEVRGLLASAAGALAATGQGIYRLDPKGAVALGPWAGLDVQAIGPTPDGGFAAVIGDGNGYRIAIVDATGAPLRELVQPDGVECKAVYVADGWLLAGGKHGLYRHDGDDWQRCWPAADGHSSAYVIGIARDRHGALHACMKKHGAEGLPAAISSSDDGKTWELSWERGYHDWVLAVEGSRAVTRWYGLVEDDAPQPAALLRAAGAASFDADGGVALLIGDRLEYRPPSGASELATRALIHPILADAEHLLLDPAGEHVVVAGEQGAYRVDLRSGAVQDCLAEIPAKAGAAKLKRLWPLGAGVVAATASYGTFRSLDGGASWLSAQSEWAQLDTEDHVVIDADTHYLIGQRCLARSLDAGASWQVIDLVTESHHYHELFCGRRCGFYLVLGSKRGCFVAPLATGTPARHLTALGSDAINALAADERQIWALDAAGRLFVVEPARGDARELTQLDEPCEFLARCDGALLAVGEEVLYRIDLDGTVSQCTAPGPGELSAVDLGDGRILLWTIAGAWSGSPGTGWGSIADWPVGGRPIKHAALLADGRALATDRDRVHHAGDRAATERRLNRAAGESGSAPDKRKIPGRSSPCTPT